LIPGSIVALNPFAHLKLFTLKQLHEASEQLFTAFTHQLSHIEATQNDIPAKAEAAIQICRQHLLQLKTLIQQYGFADQTEEIHFFKTIKPRFLHPLLYYTGIFNIHTNWPESSETILREYIKRKLYRLKQFFKKHHHFYRYYKTESTFMDHTYFVRGSFDIRTMPDSFYYEADPTFSTGYDYIFSQILANDKLLIYLEHLLKRPHNLSSTPPVASILSLPWAGSKTALVELMYALHLAGIFNNSPDIKTIATCFEQFFHIDLGNYYDLFQDIQMRKTAPTKFLDSLKNALLKKLGETD
jgi:hypothetical protein